MVDAIGHVAMALLLSAPAWVRWDGRVSLVFVGYALLTAMVPDVDLLVPGLAHNGPTHSVTFVAAVALIGGAVLAVAAEPILTRWWFEDERRLPARSTLYAFSAGALLVGGLSHLLADVLATAPAGQALAPLWPFLDSQLSVNVLAWFDDPAWTLSFLVIVVAAHVGLFLADRERIFVGP